MTIVSESVRGGPKKVIPALEAGDHLDQKTFHERYEAMPPEFRAELIGGVVVVPSPLKRPHSLHHVPVILWLGEYSLATPGTELHDGATLILGPDSEPQPDASLIIRPDWGGQTRISEDDCVAGPPELIVEVASSSQAYDMYEKYKEYERAGVSEYLVVLVREHQIRWFFLAHGTYCELSRRGSGEYESQVFPGLRLDVEAFLRLETTKVVQTLREGLSSPEHARFVEALGQRRHPS